MLVLEQLWGLIAFDYIIKLLALKELGLEEAYDSILVVTNRLTKYRYFIPYREASNAAIFMYHFLWVIVSNYGLPNKIISDRGITFALKF